MTAEYSLAVHAMVVLLHHKKDIVSSEVLADNICTNSARVRKVMSKLKHAGLVDSTEGKGSGYLAVENTEDITLYEIQQAIGEPVVSATWRSGNVDKECLIASGMGNLMDGIYSDLNTICMEHLKTITIGKIQNKIFSYTHKE